MPFWISFALLGSFVISGLQAKDLSEHLAKSAVLMIAYWNMFIFIYVLATSGLFSKEIIYSIFCLSGTMSSIVCILQGQFGKYTYLFKTEALDLWDRFPGLAEHPVEAGILGAYTGFLALVKTIDAKTLSAKCFWMVALVITLYSMKFSGSFTGMFTFAGAVGVMLVVRRAWVALAVVAGLLMLLAPIVSNPDFLGDSFMRERINALLSGGTNYETVQTRSSQVSGAIDKMINHPLTLLFGFGYSYADLVSLQGLDIHNGIVSAYFHFGLLGLATNIAIIVYLFRTLSFEDNRKDQSLVLGILLIFIGGYLTGPAFFRRAVWMLPLCCAAFARSEAVERKNEQAQLLEEEAHDSERVARIPQ
ncbi:hypothetical protein CR492_20070 [Methylocella silvestris]|uniref:O-antigen polymerase n=1 Tax=Methylocella silvestris TaxID=199596 RepID=A0A2J7TBP8_METSI|nr:hypothetical protein CR492_20070 [Methylocella silvestris]